MLWKRVATAALLVPVTVAVVLWAPLWLLAALVAVLILLALREFFRLGLLGGLPGFLPWTTLCSLLAVWMQWQADLAGGAQGSGGGLLGKPDALGGGIEIVVLVFLLGLGVAASLTKLGVNRRLAAVAASAGGFLLVALPLSYLVRIAGFPSGRRFLLLLFVLIWVGDTAAYFVGKGLGRLPMAPVLSPKKTWEGAAANLLGSVLAGFLAARWLPIPLLSVLILAALANLAGQVGDLLESAYKRSASVKDSGHLLPGHGGMLDRIDSVILAAPMVWCYLWWVASTGRLR